eukprot:gene17542-17151_t
MGWERSGTAAAPSLAGPRRAPLVQALVRGARPPIASRSPADSRALSPPRREWDGSFGSALLLDPERGG